MQDKKSYYAIIPSNVRYDTRLCANAKLLYGEISALCNERGYCWASNEYFAELYSVSRTSISKWISALKECGYINVLMQYENDKVGTRRIVLSCASTELDVDTNNNNSNSSNTTTDSEGKKEEKYSDEIKEIIDFLNSKTGSRYRYNSESTNKLIRAKLNNKYTIDDFKTVINNKCNDWLGTDWAQYLRPQTLFGNKFEQYLNQVCSINSMHTINQYSTNQHTEATDFMKNTQGDIITY